MKKLLSKYGFCFFLVLYLLPTSLTAQKYADKTIYLIDSLTLNKLNNSDKNLIDSIVKLYHQTKSDTSKYRLIEYLVEQCSNSFVWPRYNDFLLVQLEQKLSGKNLNQKEFCAYQKTLAGAYNNKGYLYGEQGNIDSQITYYIRSLTLRKKIKDKTGAAASLNNIGFAYKIKGDIKSALNYYKQSASIYQELKDTNGIALSNTNMGVLYENLGDIKQAARCYDVSLHIYESLKDKKGVSQAYYNLGSLYKTQDDIQKSFEYYRKSLALRIEIEYGSGIGFCYSNIGQLFQKQNNQDSALFYFNKALTYLKGVHKIGESSTLANIGNALINKGQPKEAIYYLEQAIKIQEEIEHKQGLASATTNLARALFLTNQLQKSKVIALKSLKISQDIGFPGNIRDAAKILTDIAKKENDYKSGLSAFELYISMRDSIKNDENEKSSFKQQTKYEYEKTQAVKDAEHTKQVELIAEKEEKQRFISLGIGVGLLLVLALAFVIYNRLKILRKQKNIIENQKLEVESQKRNVEEAHHQLSEKNKEVMDSINYAKKIQKALLKNEKHESKHLPEHFILFRPKDIISGDFYWVLEKNNYLYLAAADCTGHGVPGALLTMLGTSFLNEINACEEILKPSEILDQLRNRFIKELNQTGMEGENKDGMDISLIRIRLSENSLYSETTELMWAGANNPLYLISKTNDILQTIGDNKTRLIKNSAVITAVLPTKQPIGYYSQMSPFKNHTLTLNKGDYICLFTDGYADQFGGPKGKKYKYSAFKEKLLSVWELPMEEQKNLLLTELSQWKGQLEQVDDVCVIGIRI